MSKQQKIPATVQQKFGVASYRVGDVVLFEWLGSIRKGTVTDVQKGNTVSYTVDQGGRKFPCGTKIRNWGSHEWGNIVERVTESSTRGNGNSAGNRTRSSNNSDRGRSVKVPDSTVLEPKPRRSKNDQQNDDKPRNIKNTARNEKGRRPSYSKLDAAIKKQQDFLRKFT